MKESNELHFTTTKEYFILILVLAPLLWINVRSSQHWGDDFSVYINQTQNIISGNRFDSSTYIYDPLICSAVPSAPVGFSLLLVPVYQLFGFNMYALSLYLSIIYVAWAMLCYALFRRQFSCDVSLLIVIATFYPNFMLWLKLLICSDVPFSMWITAGFLLWTEEDSFKLPKVLAAILFFLIALITRAPAIVLLPAALSWMLYRSTVFKGLRSGYPAFLLIVFLLLGYILINHVIFPPRFRYESYTIGAFSVTKMGNNLLQNSVLYSKEFFSLYTTDTKHLHELSLLFAGVLLIVSIVSLFIQLFRRGSLLDWFVIFYLIMILTYKYTADYRYIAPVHPFLLMYAAMALQVLVEKLSISKLMMKISVVVFLFVIFSKHTTYLAQTTSDTVPGPYEDIAQKTFAYLHNNFDQKETIAFNKPRALALFSGVSTTHYLFDASAATNAENLRRRKVRYFLHSWQMHESGYDNLINLVKPHCLEEYKNWQFTLYRDTTLH